MGSLAVRMFTQGFIIPSRYAAVEANDMHQADGMQVHSWMAEHRHTINHCAAAGTWAGEGYRQLTYLQLQTA